MQMGFLPEIAFAQSAKNLQTAALHEQVRQGRGAFYWIDRQAWRGCECTKSPDRTCIYWTAAIAPAMPSSASGGHCGRQPIV